MAYMEVGGEMQDEDLLIIKQNKAGQLGRDCQLDNETQQKAMKLLRKLMTIHKRQINSLRGTFRITYQIGFEAFIKYKHIFSRTKQFRILWKVIDDRKLMNNKRKDTTVPNYVHFKNRATIQKVTKEV